MLLIFGLYVPIIGAIREFLHMNLSYLPVLIIFGCGVLTGIVGIIRIVKNALEMHRAAMVYFIFGTHGRFPLHHRYGPHHPWRFPSQP